MTEHLTETAVVGVLVLIILRETYQFVVKVRDRSSSNGSRRPTTGEWKGIRSGVDAVLARMDRIIERLEDIGDATRLTRKQVQITGELTERLCRQVDTLDETITEVVAAHRRKQDTQPGIQTG